MKIQWVDSSEQLTALSHYVYSNLDAGQNFIGVDTEFIRESTYITQIELIQIGDFHHIWLVDAAAFLNKKMDLAPLLMILSDPRIIKVIHASQQDQECLWMNFNTFIQPVFDTSVAASLCGYGDMVGLGHLAYVLLNVHLMKGQARTNWSSRPLSESLLNYAASDVQHLIPIAKLLLEKLDTLNRKEWAYELSAKWAVPQAFEYPVESIAEKLLARKSAKPQDYELLIQLLKWREGLARDLNIPRKWVVADQFLLNLTLVKPLTLEDLGSFRGVPKSIFDRYGKTLIDMIQYCKAQDLSALTKLAPPEQFVTPKTTEVEKIVVTLLEAAIKTLCLNQQIASKYLISKENLVELLRSPYKDFDTFKKTQILSEVSFNLLGKDLFLLLTGQTQLKIDNGKIVFCYDKEE
jgi:ribonuclease D